MKQSHEPAMAARAPGPALDKLRVLLRRLDESRMRYCHWKSNYHIEFALAAQEDLDILIDASRWGEFVQIVHALDFKPADSLTSREQPGVYHFLGNDGVTGTLINVHAYSRILTGDHFSKSWALPFEDMLLSDTHEVGGIRIPDASGEIIVFVLRNMIKLTTLVDAYLFRRSEPAVVEEWQWLTARADTEKILAKLTTHFPDIPSSDFERAQALLGVAGHWPEKTRLAFRFRRRLKKYRRQGQLRQSIVLVGFAARMAINKYLRKQKHMQLHSGGKIIALVGPQATGKSTLATAVSRWLGVELSVRNIHAGKPPGTLLTFLPNRLIPLLRSLLPNQATVKVEKELEDDETMNFPMVFLLRKLLLAYERNRLLRRAFQQSRNGRIIVSDRYPSDAAGAIDGATFSDAAIDRQTFAIKRWIMSAERRLYRNVCPPDFVIMLTVSVEKAVERNEARIKSGKQTTAYVRLRHSMRQQPEFRHCPTLTVSTDDDIDTTLLTVKQAIWEHL